ncbi:hypothetical protein SAMN05216499_13323 [Actinacidiphila paucisporea]|uniref:Uncharacterized protein n=1 Tax=Actinacidiphila paucisporea TaxID=310782 RepID=A0A1M7QEV3_9ACTN|nr:hypothetical protein SAMN05216499_13323 [Actinacidiphila paucisporea]
MNRRDCPGFGPGQSRRRDGYFFSEVVDERDRFYLAMLHQLGITKGEPFAPDERTARILEQGAAAGELMAQARCPRAGLLVPRPDGALFFGDGGHPCGGPCLAGASCAMDLKPWWSGGPGVGDAIGQMLASAVGIAISSSPAGPARATRPPPRSVHPGPTAGGQATPPRAGSKRALG